MKIDPAIGCSFRIERPHASQKLKRRRTRYANAVVSDIPYFNTIEFPFYAVDKIDAAFRRVRQYSKPTGVVYSVDELLHTGRMHTFINSVTEDMDGPTFQRELESGNHEESRTRQAVAQSGVSSHFFFVEHFGM